MEQMELQLPESQSAREIIEKILGQDSELKELRVDSSFIDEIDKILCECWKENYEIIQELITTVNQRLTEFFEVQIASMKNEKEKSGANEFNINITNADCLNNFLTDLILELNQTISSNSTN